MVPSKWGYVSALQVSSNMVLTQFQVDKRDDPYAPQKQGGCCVVM